jgi:tRNA 2-thiocytidine biosynthesis protein TtcA
MRADPQEDRQRLNRCAGRLVGKLRRTVRRWALLPPGARTAVALSGGIDSLALAFLLLRGNRQLADPLRLCGLHVRLASSGVTAGLGEGLRAWCEERGLEVAEVEPRLAAGEGPPLDCFGCARVRRRTLLEAASERGCSHLALGHHADDVVETWLLSLFYTGHPDLLAPARSYFAGAVTVVRPLYEIRKRELVRLSHLARLPQPVEACGREREGRRRRVVAALAALGRDETLVRRQLFWAAVREQAPEGGGDER